MWDQAEETWIQPGIVEYGIYQIDAVPRTPIWRRHKGGGQMRFGSVSNALFARQGARNACKGLAPYPRNRYAAGDELFVPYVATWLKGSPIAYLVRASADAPEVTLVSPDQIEEFSPRSDQQALQELSRLFAEGATNHGIRWLTLKRIEIP
jgi:hypothetical protein